LLDLFRCIALHLFLSQLLSKLICLLELYKLSFILWFVILGCLEFFLKEYFNYLFCMKFSRYIFDCLSVIRTLNSLKTLITGNPVIYNSTSLLI
jgi:hypothetical protein